jgi:hypothetical protein
LADTPTPEGEAKPAPRTRPGASADGAATTLAKRALVTAAEGVSGRTYTLLAVIGVAFASIWLLVGWQFGPKVLVDRQQYRSYTGRVDARVVDRWLAVEFDPQFVRNSQLWRGEANASACAVVEYAGDWGAPLQRSFCGTRSTFTDGYPVAGLRTLADGVPFAWDRDERGFAVPELRLAPATVQWLRANAPDRFMHRRWPAATEFDWLRLDLDRPLDAAANGWTAPPPVLPLAFDPAHPADALPAAIVAARLDQPVFWPALVLGFGVGGYIWFKAMQFMPLLSGLAPWARWILSALPLLTLPWWLDGLPQVLGRVSPRTGELVRIAFADIGRTDRLVAAAPVDATLAAGERVVWRLPQSVYADTLGRFRFAPPATPYASKEAALAAITATIADQLRAYDDAQRAALFAHLMRNRHDDHKDGESVYLPAAKAALADPASGAETRRLAARFVNEYGLAVDD